MTHQSQQQPSLTAEQRGQKPVFALGAIDADRVVLEAHGDFDAASTTMIQERFDQLTGAGIRHVTLDLALVRTMSTAVALTLVLLQRRFRCVGGSLRFDSVTNEVAGVLSAQANHLAAHPAGSSRR